MLGRDDFAKSPHGHFAGKVTLRQDSRASGRNKRRRLRPDGIGGDSGTLAVRGQPVVHWREKYGSAGLPPPPEIGFVNLDSLSRLIPNQRRSHKDAGPAFSKKVFENALHSDLPGYVLGSPMKGAGEIASTAAAAATPVVQELEKELAIEKIEARLVLERVDELDRQLKRAHKLQRGMHEHALLQNSNPFQGLTADDSGKVVAAVPGALSAPKPLDSHFEPRGRPLRYDLEELRILGDSLGVELNMAISLEVYERSPPAHCLVPPRLRIPKAPGAPA